MYRTYQNKESDENSGIRFEEKLTPKEIEEKKNENKKAKSVCNTSSGKSLSDDLFLILIILLLFKEQGEDNFLSLIIIALLL